jgi:hypothetical protein
MKDVNQYKTKDFYLGAALLAFGIPLQKLESIGIGIYLFVFGTSEESAEQIIKSYWDRSLELPARDFVDAINELKTRIHLGS